jgi:D-glycero-alpha-D-manno-heptose-7-phosphate kinase
MDIKKGIDIFVKAESPPGCGTGTSASVAVALIAALANYNQRELKRYEIAKLAHALETEELKLESGVQDQYAASYGGLNFMEIDYPSVNIIKIEINEKRIYELENQLILVYLSSRSSDKMHKAVIENFLHSNKSTLDSFEIMKNCAYEMRKAIFSDLDEIGQVINTNWEAQKNLHPLMVSPEIKKLEKIAKENGAIGFKCNGAGGGGSATILAGIGRAYKLNKEIIKSGFRILPCKLAFKGVSSFNKQN